MARFPCFIFCCALCIVYKDFHHQGRTRGVSCLVPCLSGSSSLKIVEYKINQTFIPDAPAPTTPMRFPTSLSPSMKKEMIEEASENVIPSTTPELKNHTERANSKALHSIITAMKSRRKSSVHCPSVLSYPSYSIPASCLSSPL